MLAPADRVIMISGANRGIGYGVARRLAASGFRLSLGARDLAALSAAVADLPAERTACFAYDAADLGLAEAWVAGTVARFGRIDGLVNNAGIAKPPYRLDDADESALDAMWAVNVKGPLRLVRLALPHLLACGHGRVVNVASLSGKRVKNDNVGYAMTKYAVVALTHAIRRHGWDQGLRATAVCPSFVRTDLTADVDKVTADEMIQPEDLAQLVETALNLPDNAVVAEMLVNCRLEDLF
ncbi:MAG: SDR family NAD(P)-dependent oxidoreductase [Rhodospirillaceae bacterium]|nr:SDR family NAD(P)-dependent oxidoreductase [Rhodospirillaceae bacterium]